MDQPECVSEGCGYVVYLEKLYLCVFVLRFGLDACVRRKGDVLFVPRVAQDLHTIRKMRVVVSRLHSETQKLLLLGPSAKT